MKFSGNISSLFSCFVFLCLFSCSEKEEPSAASPVQVTKCVPLSDVTIYPKSVHYDSTEYIYESNNRLDKFIAKYSSTDIVDIIYNQNGSISQILDGNGTVFEQRKYGATGKLDSIIYLTNNPLGKAVYAKIMEYNNVGLLKRINTVAPPGINMEPHYITFTYNAAGLIATDSIFDIIGNDTILNNTGEYQYDNKIGLYDYGFPFGTSNEMYIFFHYKHNITSEKRTYRNGRTNLVTFDYQYNSLDYPIEIKMYNRGTLIRKTTIEYSCF